MGVFACLRSEKQPPFAVLTRPFKLTVLVRDRFDRYLPRTSGWAWAWRVEQWVFGQRKPILLDAEILLLADPSRDMLASLGLGTPNFSEPNGLQIWMFSAEELKALRGRLKQMAGTAVLMHPRIQTADAIASGLSQGDSVALNGSTHEVGLTMNCFARVRRDVTDLMADIRFSELVTNTVTGSGGTFLSNAVSIQTNLYAAVRMQIPNGSRVFLLNGFPARPGRKCIGVTIDLARPKT